MNFQTGLQATEQIESIQKFDTSSLITLSKPIKERIGLTEAMAQTASLHFKKAIQFSGHTFIGSVKNLHINSLQANTLFQQKKRAVFIEANRLSSSNKERALYQVKAYHTPANKPISKAQIIVIKKRWGETFPEIPLKKEAEERFDNLIQKGKTTDE